MHQDISISDSPPPSQNVCLPAGKKNSSEFSRLIAQVRGRRETKQPARNKREDAVKEETSPDAHAAGTVEEYLRSHLTALTVFLFLRLSAWASTCCFKFNHLSVSRLNDTLYMKGGEELRDGAGTADVTDTDGISVRRRRPDNTDVRAVAALPL